MSDFVGDRLSLTRKVLEKAKEGPAIVDRPLFLFFLLAAIQHQSAALEMGKFIVPPLESAHHPHMSKCYTTHQLWSRSRNAT